MRLLRGLVRLCAVAGLLVLAGSYLGALHPLGDSLAVFRLQIAMAVALLGALAVVAGLSREGLVAVAVAGVAYVDIELYGIGFTPPDLSGPSLTIYSKNLGAGRVDWVALGEDIEFLGADVIVLQEMTQATMVALPALLPDHPYQHICNFSGWSAMAVASRWPVSEGGCTDHRSLAYTMVDVPGGPVWVASIHQVWPYPHEQAALLPDILAAVEAAPERQVIAGDFNMVPWGSSVRRIASAGGLNRIGPVFPTIEVRGIALPIDHVLTDGVANDFGLRERMGSDHYGLVARISWTAP